MQADPSRVFLLRSCSEDFTSYDGKYQWPSEVGAECRPDNWNPEPKCGNGLHGFVDGEGDAYLADWSDSAQWLVFSAPVGDVVVVGPDKSKAASARIEHIGVGETGADRLRSCLDFLATIDRLGPWAMSVVRRGGDHAVLTGGYGCTLTGGDYSRLTGGDACRLTGGHGSRLRGGDYSHITGGDYADLTGGDHSTLSGGRDSRLTGGYGSRLTGGDRSRLTGGDYSVLKGGFRSNLMGGYCSRLTGGHRSDLTFKWWDRSQRCERLVWATVGLSGIKPDTPYVVAEDGSIVEAAEE